MRISVIIATYNRKDELRELLQSLEDQTLPKEDFEIVVVDDGSSDGTQEWLQEYRRESSMQIHLVQQQNAGPATARNRGMREATADFFVFIDSDCIAPPAWLERIHHAVNAEKLDAFGGPDEAREDFPPLLKAISYSMTSFLSTGGLRGKTGVKLAKYYPRSFNMGVKKKIYEEIGGFSNLRFGEDIEFSGRIINSGARVEFLEDAYVYHKRRTSLRQFFKQVFNSGVARIRLFLRDPQSLEPLHALPALATLFILALSVLALFSEPARAFWLLCFVAYLIIMFSGAITAGLRYKSLLVAMLTPIVMTIQVLGYAFGFLSGVVNLLILKRYSYIGYSKTYYQ